MAPFPGLGKGKDGSGRTAAGAALDAAYASVPGVRPAAAVQAAPLSGVPFVAPRPPSSPAPPTAPPTRATSQTTRPTATPRPGAARAAPSPAAKPPIGSRPAIADRFRVKYGRALAPVNGVRRDYLIASIGSVVLGVQLHQAERGSPFIVASMPLPDQHLTQSEVAEAVLQATRKQLPNLFHIRK